MSWKLSIFNVVSKNAHVAVADSTDALCDVEVILKNTFLSILNSQFLKRVFIGVSIVFTVFQLSVFLPKTLCRTDKSRDLYAYYLVKERIEQRDPIYLDLSNKGPHDLSLALYLYPPVFAGALSLFPKMSFLMFARFWTLLLYGAYWIYAATLGRLAFGRFSLSATVPAGLILFFFPGTFRALSLGQIDPLLWALFGLALSMPTFRGWFTMLVAIIKPRGIWPLFWSVGEGLRVWVGATMVLLGSALVGILAFGGDAFVENCRIWF
ncbi:MAG: glycosyltransferase family 87 protein, partial [Syntrophotalea sp.]|uniref:glycosyltransferase family 87 protein n=1 Tax=Syntrophotalea sp. TaxID=2812029 RepID=UPI003D100B50